MPSNIALLSAKAVSQTWVHTSGLHTRTVYGTVDNLYESMMYRLHIFMLPPPGHAYCSVMHFLSLCPQKNCL